jgi:hypothetical protein
MGILVSLVVAFSMALLLVLLLVSAAITWEMVEWWNSTKVLVPGRAETGWTGHVRTEGRRKQPCTT